MFRVVRNCDFNVSTILSSGCSGHQACAGLPVEDIPVPKGLCVMTLLKWAAIFAVLAIVAAIFGFGGIAAGLADIARILFFLFLIVVVILVVLGIAAYRKIT